MVDPFPHSGAPVRTCQMSLCPKPNCPSLFGKLFTAVDCLLIFWGWFLAKILVFGVSDTSKLPDFRIVYHPCDRQHHGETPGMIWTTQLSIFVIILNSKVCPHYGENFAPVKGFKYVIKMSNFITDLIRIS